MSFQSLVASLSAAIPRRALWILASAVFCFAAARLLIRWLKRRTDSAVASGAPAPVPGPVEVLYRQLQNARRSAHSRELVARGLRELAVKAVSLREEIPEAEAARKIDDETWTADPSLRDMMRRARRPEWRSKSGRRDGEAFAGLVEGFLERVRQFAEGRDVS
jgi:hypothetical protein